MREAYVEGISTRSVDDSVEAMGIDSGISKSEVSRICAGLHETVGAFRTALTYIRCDTKYRHRGQPHGCELVRVMGTTAQEWA